MLCPTNIFRISCLLCDNVRKYDTADRPQMTIKYGACTVHVGHLRLQTHTQNM